MYARRNSLSKIKKIVFYSVLSLVLLSALSLFTCNFLVVSNAEGKIFSDTDKIPVSDAGLLLGTTPQSRIGRKPNLFFTYRVDAAEKLYRSGKIRHIIISGDDNSLDGINEPECMRDTLIARGVPADVISTDGKGLRTINSVERMGSVFGISSYTVISQRFHNERAVYLAEHIKPEAMKVMAFNAESPTSNTALITYIREYFARVKMFIDIAMINIQEIL